MLMRSEDLEYSSESKMQDLEELEDLERETGEAMTKSYGRHKIDPRPSGNRKARKPMKAPSSAPPNELIDKPKSGLQIGMNSPPACNVHQESKEIDFTASLPESTQSRARALARQRELQLKKRQASMGGSIMRGATPTGQFTPGVTQFSAPRTLRDDPYAPFSARRGSAGNMSHGIAPSMASRGREVPVESGPNQLDFSPAVRHEERDTHYDDEEQDVDDEHTAIYRQDSGLYERQLHSRAASPREKRVLPPPERSPPKSRQQSRRMSTTEDDYEDRSRRRSTKKKEHRRQEEEEYTQRRGTPSARRKSRDHSDDDDDEAPYSRRRHRKEEDDEDQKRSRRSSRRKERYDDEDDYEPPRRRKERYHDEEEEEEYRPRQRRSSKQRRSRQEEEEEEEEEEEVEEDQEEEEEQEYRSRTRPSSKQRARPDHEEVEEESAGEEEEDKDEDDPRSRFVHKDSDLKNFEQIGMSPHSDNGANNVIDEHSAESKVEEPPAPEFDITALPLHNMRFFLTNPCPRAAGVVQCYIKRNRSGVSKLFPEYYVYMKEGNRFLMCSKKRPNNKTSNYLISMAEHDLKRNSKNYIGKLRANFAGTEFQIYDDGSNPNKHGDDDSRTELGAVIYTSNVLGSRGPRKMQVGIPKILEAGHTDEAKSNDEPCIVDDILSKMKAHDYSRLVYTVNKPPRWNEQVGAYVLNFNGRVTMASVKNFQLVQPDEQESILLQFGRVGKDEFTMDFQWPMTPLAAFAITLSSFDSKIACD